MKKKNGFLFIIMLMMIVFVNAQTTYNWVGGSSGNYQTPANWLSTAATPAARNTPAATDILQFSSSATVTNVPTETIGQLILSGTAVVSLQPATGYVTGVNASRTLTIGNTNTSDNDLQIPSGCELIIAANSFTSITLPATYGAGASDRDKISNALTIVLSSSSSPKANIAGKLTIEREATFTLPSTPAALTATTFASTSYVYLNQNLYTVTAGTTANTTSLPTSTFGSKQTNGTSTLTYIGSLVSGSITSGSQFSSFANTYSVANGVTTVASTGTIENKSAAIASVAAARLLFSSDATYIYNRADGNSAIPTVSDLSGVNLKIKGITSSSFTPTIALPSPVKSLDWNTPNITGTASCRISSSTGTTLTISGNASFTNGNTSSSIGANSGGISTVNITGDLTLSSCNLYTGRGTADWTVNGNLSMTGGYINILDGLNSTSSITSNLTVKGSVTLSGTASLRLNNQSSNPATANLNIWGNLTIGSSATLTTSSSTLQIGNLTLNGSTVGAQTITSSGTVSGPINVTLNNSFGASLGAPLSLPSTATLTLSSGLITTTTTNLLTIANTATTAITGSSSSYVTVHCKEHYQLAWLLAQLMCSQLVNQEAIIQLNSLTQPLPLQVV